MTNNQYSLLGKNSMYRKKFPPPFVPFPSGHIGAIHRQYRSRHDLKSEPEGYRLAQQLWICLGGNFLICYSSCFQKPYSFSTDMATRKNSLLCPNCRRLISRDEARCPYCGLSSPASWWKSHGIKVFGEPDQLLKILIGINIGMFILSLLLSHRSTGMALNPLAFLAPDTRSLLLLGATGTVPISGLHRWWTLISANYLHGSLMHILFNMLALRQLAPLVMREYGTHRMLAIYTLGGVLGYLVSYLAGVRITIGASAAVCSLIGAVLYYGKSRGGVYGQAIYSQVGGWAVGIFIFGFILPGINNWGHGGGMAGGVMLGFLLGYMEKKRETFAHRMLGTVCALVTLLVLCWAILTGFITRFF
jgi:rhomboid protease GluP